MNRVWQLRKEKGVTQEAFAEDIGVSRQTVIAIEKGNYIPSLLLGIKIAKFFKKPSELHFSYPRYLENEIRKEFGFTGTAINLKFKNKPEKGS